MTNTDRPAGRVHQGRNIKRFREMFGIKQEALALAENERVEDEVLEHVAKTVRAIIAIRKREN